MAFIGNQIITINSLLDLDGQELVLDADADSTIHVSTDDQIDFKIGGTDVATFTNSSSDFVITQAVQDKDIIFKGDDGGSAITALTLDMSEAGNASFNGTVTANAGVVVDNITIDGTEIDLSSGNLTIDVAGGIILDTDAGELQVHDGGTEYVQFKKDSSNVQITAGISDGDIVFRGNDGGSMIEAMRIDTSEGGRVGIGTTSPSTPLHVVGNNGILIDENGSGDGQLYFGGISGSDRSYIARNADDFSIWNVANGTMKFATSNDEKMTILANGNVGIGVTSPTAKLHIETADNSEFLKATITGNEAWAFKGASGAGITDYVSFGISGGTQNMAWQEDGKVGIGTTSPSDQLEISRTSTDQTVGLTITNEQAGGYGSGIVFRSKRSDTGDLLAAGEIQVTGENSWNGAGNVASMMEFFTQKDGTLTRHMSLSKNGILMIGHNNYTPNSHTGVFLNGGSGKGFFTVNGDAPLAIHRLSSDGDLVELRQDNNTEGTISVSGSTVSYNGFSGQHETSGIATNTEIGTVVSTIDELDTYFSGDKKGQTRADHAKVKVSDSAGDNCVYGVVSRFDSDGKAFIASVGIGTIRVTGACAKGDLLESNGDGTAKVQSDDIIRSKTIGKVTIGNSNSGVKLVSCVLYCG